MSKERTSTEKKLAKVAECANMAGYVNFRKLSQNGKPGHYIFEFERPDGKKDEKELCVVNSKYKTLWSGDCFIYLPTLQFATPKSEVYMITPSGDSYNLVYIGPRFSLANVFQTKGQATLVLNYYAQNDKSGYPAFRIDDEDNMPLGRKVRAEVRVQEKKNEKGTQIIVDCFVYLSTEPSRNPGTEKFLAVQKFLPAGFKSFKTFEIGGEDRKVFICEK